MKFPIVKHTTHCPKNGKCPVCKKRMNSDFICFTSGALMRTGKDSFVMDETLMGFGGFSKHYDSTEEYKSVMLADYAKNGQYEIYTCSIKCMKELFNELISKLV